MSRKFDAKWMFDAYVSRHCPICRIRTDFSVRIQCQIFQCAWNCLSLQHSSILFGHRHSIIELSQVHYNILLNFHVRSPFKSEFIDRKNWSLICTICNSIIIIIIDYGITLTKDSPFPNSDILLIDCVSIDAGELLCIFARQYDV